MVRHDVRASTCVKPEAALRLVWRMPSTWETRMTWKTPKVVEVPVGMEINMYACAARK
jgi:coenzyme PQQ precursor peptide PqqA